MYMELFWGHSVDFSSITIHHLLNFKDLFLFSFTCDLIGTKTLLISHELFQKSLFYLNGTLWNLENANANDLFFGFTQQAKKLFLNFYIGAEIALA